MDAPLPPVPFDCLVVDDVMLNQHVLTNFLKRLSCTRISVASDGAAALQWLLERLKLDEVARQRPPLVFMDLVMPVLDGRDAIVVWRDLEARFRLPPARIFVVTADVRVNVSGMDGYITKPIAFESLRRIVEDFSEGRK